MIQSRSYLDRYNRTCVFGFILNEKKNIPISSNVDPCGRINARGINDGFGSLNVFLTVSNFERNLRR